MLHRLSLLVISNCFYSFVSSLFNSPTLINLVHQGWTEFMNLVPYQLHLGPTVVYMKKKPFKKTEWYLMLQSNYSSLLLYMLYLSIHIRELRWYLTIPAVLFLSRVITGCTSHAPNLYLRVQLQEKWAGFLKTVRLNTEGLRRWVNSQTVGHPTL